MSLPSALCAGGCWCRCIYRAPVSRHIYRYTREGTMTTRYFFAQFIAAGAALLLGGCANLPLGIGGGNGDAAVPDVHSFKTYEILYATDRSPPDADATKRGLPCGKRRGPMSYGVATITVPDLASTAVGEKTANVATAEK